MLATANGGAWAVDDEQTQVAGWVAGGIGLLVALIAWGREFFRQRHDITRDFGGKMLARIEALEQREQQTAKEARGREDTLRGRIEAVETEADECAKNFTALKSKYDVLHRDYEDLREENDEMREELKKARSDLDVVRAQNLALHRELEGLYRQIGAKRTPSSPHLDPPKVPPLPAPKQSLPRIPKPIRREE